MKKICIVGYGNIGRQVAEAVWQAPDMTLCGVIRRTATGELPGELRDVQVAERVAELAEKPDGAILCVPSRMAEGYAKAYLEKGIHTVDSFDIHGEIWDMKCRLDAVAKENHAVSVISAGWDPGSDSVVRTLMEACAPKGITYTNFGPGMSMGHTVAVKAVRGVHKALAVTIPLGTGIHRRMVYVQLEQGADFADIAARIKRDDYFVHDETHVIQVDDVDALLDMGHGVQMQRKGVSGVTQNQLFEFTMKINNPALTAQILVGAMRASFAQKRGCYTLIELPPIDLVCGDRESLIRRLV